MGPMGKARLLSSWLGRSCRLNRARGLSVSAAGGFGVFQGIGLLDFRV